ncbi:MAG: alpha/beta hydrolase [Legionellales bacterium]|nr:alpha/beta hydrolase [Legionellales bacterium]
MSPAFIAAMLPWLVFFFFANPSHIETAAIVSLLTIGLLNFQQLKQGKLWDWCSTLYLAGLSAILFLHPLPWLQHHGYLLSNLYLASLLLLSLYFKRPLLTDYYRDVTPKTQWHTETFYHYVYTITFIWAGIFIANALISWVVITLHGEKIFMLDWFLPIVFIALGLFTTHFYVLWHTQQQIQLKGVAHLKNISEIKVITTEKSLFSYRILGSGTPLLLLADAYMSMHSWDPDFLILLSQSHQVIIFDYPGVGASRMEKPCNLANLSDYLNSALQALQLNSLCLAGYGMGGWIALHFAAHYPDQLQKLALIASDGGTQQAQLPTPEIQTFFQEIGDLYQPKHFKRYVDALFPPEYREAMTQRLQALYSSASFYARITPATQTWQAQLRQAWYDLPELAESIKKLSIPCLILAATLDEINLLENSRYLAHLLSHAQLTLIENAGHGLIYQEPAWVADHLTTFCLN